jgi:DNA-binding transcriptional LysR family regulator
MDSGLRHLKHLVAAVQYGTLRRAAEALHVRQSTLSRAITQFEKELGITLFVRSTGGVRLTPAGRQFFESAQRVLADFEALLCTARALGSGSAGKLIIGLPASSGSLPIRRALTEYAMRHPGVTIQLVVKPKIGMLYDLDVGALDIAIVAGAIPQERHETLTLSSERVMVVMPEGHRFAKAPFVQWADVATEPFLTSRLGLGPELTALMAAQVGSRSMSRVELHSAEGEALLSLVAAGRGLTLQSAGSLRAQQPGLVHVEVHGETGTSWITFSACWKHDRSNPALTTFVALLRTHRSVSSLGCFPDT